MINDLLKVEYVVSINDALDGMLAKITGAGLAEVEDATKLTMSEKLDIIKKAAEELKQIEREDEAEIETELRMDALFKKGNHSISIFQTDLLSSR